MSRLLRAVRFAAPFTVSVCVGVATATVVVSYYHHYLIRQPAGVSQPADVRRVLVTRSGGTSSQAVAPVVSTRELAELEESMRGQVALAAYSSGVEATLDEGRVRVSRMTGTFIQLLGVRLLLGRFPDPIHYRVGSERVAVISGPLWERAFDRDPATVGRRVLLDGVSTLVVGITEAGFRGIDRSPTDVWVPARAGPGHTDVVGLQIVARVPGSMSDSLLQTLIQASARRTDALRSASVALRPLNGGRFGADLVDRAAVLALWLGLGATALSFTNAGLMCALRVRDRAASLRMRWALGAPTPTLVREIALLPIVLVITTAIIVVAALPRAALLLESVGVPGAALVAAPARVAAATAGVGAVLMTLIVCGAGVSWAARWRSPDLMNVLPRSLAGLTAAHVLVVSVAGTIAAPIAAGTRSLMRVDPGFDLNTIVVRMDAGEGPPLPAPAVLAALRQLQASPGVLTAAVANGLPLTATSILSASHDPVLQGVAAHVITFAGDFPGALGIPMTEGGAHGRDGVIISAAMARRVGGAYQPACLRLDPEGCEPLLGIARDVNMVALGERPLPVVYRRASPVGSPMFFVLRHRGSGAAPVRTMHEVLSAALPTASLHRFTMADVVRGQRAPVAAVSLAALSLFGAAATIVVLGLALTTRMAVDERRRELGIRSALGAPLPSLLSRALAGLLVTALVSAAAGCILGLRVGAAIVNPSAGTRAIQVMATCSIVIVVAIVSVIPAAQALRTPPRALLNATD